MPSAARHACFSQARAAARRSRGEHRGGASRRGTPNRISISSSPENSTRCASIRTSRRDCGNAFRRPKRGSHCKPWCAAMNSIRRRVCSSSANWPSTFDALVTFPPEAVEATPDEQYVRNVVDVLFRPPRHQATRRREARGAGSFPERSLARPGCAAQAARCPAPLTNAEKRDLKARAQRLEPVVKLGHGGAERGLSRKPRSRRSASTGW